MELWESSAGELTSAYTAGAASPIEAVASVIARIEANDDPVGAFTVTTFERALAEARARTDELVRGERRGSLHGVPVAVKELYDVAGAETSYGSEMLVGRVPKADAAAVGRLKAAGAVVVGLTRTHEFAWGITTQHETRGSTRNPWNPDFVPGGSSGGSAAAVACGFVPIALGSDTAGSIRIPAAYCGVMGFKPTYGTVSLDGACPLSPSLDHGGPLARTGDDIAACIEALIGAPSGRGREDLNDLVVAVCPDLRGLPLADEHEAAFQAAVEIARGLGAGVVETPFESAEGMYEDVFSPIQLYEAYRVHTEDLGFYPGRADEYSASVARRIELAGTVTRADYERAVRRRDEIRTRFAELFEVADLLIAPCSAGPPSPVSDPNRAPYGGERVPFRDVVLPYTVPFNLAGVPACTVPVALDALGIPVGVQIAGGFGADDLVVAAAGALVRALGPPRFPEVEAA